LLSLMNETERAQAAIAEARQNVTAVSDAAMRARAAQFVDVAQGVVLRSTDPAKSRALLDQAIAFLTSRNDHHFAPDAYPERCRRTRSCWSMSSCPGQWLSSAYREIARTWSKSRPTPIPSAPPQIISATCCSGTPRWRQFRQRRLTFIKS